MNSTYGIWIKYLPMAQPDYWTAWDVLLMYFLLLARFGSTLSITDIIDSTNDQTNKPVI